MTPSASDAVSAGADTLSERAAALVETDIVSGALAPGARLGIAERAAHYGIGATPLREGLSRLVARGLVDAIGQRGFRVKEISREDLADIVRIRSLIECEGIGEMRNREREQARSYLLGKLFRRHPGHGVPSIEIARSYAQTIKN